MRLRLRLRLSMRDVMVAWQVDVIVMAVVDGCEVDADTYVSECC